MTTCTIIIKIKDYFPKIESIPYQNFVCLFTNGENEGQLPLISQENESYQHQIKNIISDIKYKVHVLDYNDMSLIGMCDMTIPYNIINQISPPNGFIQEQQKKLLMDVNTKRKLFGTVLNMGDIYLNIYSEIYLSEKKEINVTKNSKTTTRKKNLISLNNGLNKKLDGSPRTVKKKKLLMQINSDRQALMNINKNNLLNKSNIDVQKNFGSNNKIEKSEKNTNNVSSVINSMKPNSSFNYKEIPIKENKISMIPKIKSKNTHTNKSLRENKQKIKNRPDNNNNRKSRDKKIINTNNNKENIITNNSNNNNINNNNNLLNRIIKTESNSKNNNSNKENNQKAINKNNVFLENNSPKMYNDNEEIQFNKNNTGNKITTIESLDNIDISGKKYITKAKTKKNNNNSANNNNINVVVNANNTLFSTNSTDQEFNEIDKNILEKGTEIRNDFNNQLNNENALNQDIDKNQIQIKENFVKLIDFYCLLCQKLLKLHQKNIFLNKKSNIYKEKLFNELKKNNILTQKKTTAEIENFINVNNHGSLNEKFLRSMIKVKKSEFKISIKIFLIYFIMNTIY